MEFEIHGIWIPWDSWNLRFMEFEFHEIHGIWDSWNLRFMEFEFHEIHGIWDSWNLKRCVSSSFDLFMLILPFPFAYCNRQKKIIFTLFRGRFLLSFVERATYFREKVCFCFPFRFLRERSTVLGSLAGTSTLNKRHGCHFMYHRPSKSRVKVLCIFEFTPN